MTQVVALILALAKALPTVERLLAMLEAQRASARVAELHRTIDEAIRRAQSEAPVCPHSDCPMRRLREHAAAQRRGQAAPAP